MAKCPQCGGALKLWWTGVAEYSEYALSCRAECDWHMEIPESSILGKTIEATIEKALEEMLEGLATPEPDDQRILYRDWSELSPAERGG